MTTDTLIQQAADLIRNSKKLVVLTGAGVSKESGVPTFRDALDGLWAEYDPMKLATPQAFRANPKLVWDFYEYRRSIIAPATPNPGHRALAALEQRFPEIPIITQNVDRLHEAAGSRHVIHLHGDIHLNRCSANCQGSPTILADDVLVHGGEDEVPRCPHCGSPARPDVVWFGEMLPLDQLDEAKHVSAGADVMLVVGTSGVIMPAADMPVIAKRAGAKIIEINPDETPITPITDIWLQGTSGEILPRVVAALDA